MIDNIEKIVNSMVFKPYEMQYRYTIIQRTKDGHDRNFSITCKNFKTLESFYNDVNVIKEICDKMDARLYIYYNPAHYVKVLEFLEEEIKNNNSNNTDSLMPLVDIFSNGIRCTLENPEYFLLDFDFDGDADLNIEEIDRQLKEKNIIPKLKVPTLNGEHWVFDMKFIKETLPIIGEQVGVHYNAPVLAYAGKNLKSKINK